MRNTVAPTLALAVFLLGIAWLVLGCGKKIESQPAEAPLAVGSMDALGQTAAKNDHGSKVGRYRSHLYSEHDADVHTYIDELISGTDATMVRSISVEIGDRVNEGQMLAQLEDRHVSLAVTAAQARADEARAKAARTKQLLDREVAAPAEYETLVNLQRVAEAELGRVQLELARAQIRAPFSGVVSRRYVTLGQRVMNDTPLFRVTAMSPLRARFLISEGDMLGFEIGSTILLTAVDGATVEGKVVRVSPTIDPASGTREVIVEITETGELLPGAEVLATPTAATELPTEPNEP
jgi:RND family efflux transporter MFP subunit